MSDLGSKRKPWKAIAECKADRLVPILGIPIYEEALNRDPKWALSEGSRHFEESSTVFTALHKITSRLNGLGVPLRS